MRLPTAEVEPGLWPPHCHRAPSRALEVLLASEASLAASQGSFPYSLDQEPAPRAWGRTGSSGLAASGHPIPLRLPGGPHLVPLISVGRFNEARWLPGGREGMCVPGEECAPPPHRPVSSGPDRDVPGKREARMMACSSLPGEPSPDTLIRAHPSDF